MSAQDADVTLMVVESGRQRVVARLRAAVEAQIAARADIISVDPDSVDAIVDEAAGRAGGSLWRIALAEAVADHYRIGLREALAHPTVAAAEQLVGIDEEPVWAAESPEAESWIDTPPTLADPWSQGEAEPWEDSVPAAEPWTPPPPPAAADFDEPVVAAVPDPWSAPDEPAATPDEPAVDAWGASLDDEPAMETEPEPSAPMQAVPDPPPLDDEPAWAPESEPEPDWGPEPEPEPTPATAAAPPQALRVAAVHTGGIESLKKGEKDIELRMSDAGLDVLKRSTGVAIGRLDWSGVTRVEVAGAKRRRDRRKGRGQTLEVTTGAGQATFELVGLSPEEIDEHLEPMLARLRAAGALAG